MEFKVDAASTTVSMDVHVTDGPVMQDRDTTWFRVSLVELTYGHENGDWDTESNHDVVLSGMSLGGGEWTTMTLPYEEFTTMDTSHPWLYHLINNYTPSGDVDLSATHKTWSPS